MRIKISKKNEELLDEIIKLYNFKNSGLIARIAFAYSIQKNKRFANYDTLLESDGKEFRDEKVIFGTFITERSNYFLFKSVLCQHYDKILTEEQFINLFRLHMNYGLENIYKEITNFEYTSGEHIEYLIRMIKKGIGLLSSNIPNNYKWNKSNLQGIEKIISFELGKNDDGERIVVNLNREFEPQHIAIAGMTRSGKTELIKFVLSEIFKSSDGKLKFIFFDYKGEGKSETLKTFLSKTKCKFINIDEESFEFNPLSSIEINDERQMMMDITSFVDSISSVEPKIGPAQKHILKSLLLDCFQQSSREKIPTVNNLFEQLKSYYENEEKNADTLYSIIENLASFIFKEPANYDTKIYDQSIYLNLPATASDTLRQILVYMTLKYLLLEFLKMTPVVQNEDGIKPLRYIIVIDEAHVYLRTKSARKVLEDFLRLISSKGVAVILLSQGVEDYKHKDFDFTSQIKLSICLNVMNKDINLIRNYMGTPKNETKLKNSINKLESGKALICINEPQIININQFWRDIG